MAEQIVIILEDNPTKNKLPVSSIVTLQDAKEYGDREPKRGKVPMATALVREGLRAYANNVTLVKQCRELMNGADDTTFTAIVKSALEILVRAKLYAATKKPDAARITGSHTKKKTSKKTTHQTRKD